MKIRLPIPQWDEKVLSTFYRESLSGWEFLIPLYIIKTECGEGFEEAKVVVECELQGRGQF